MTITRERLVELLDYDPATGIFKWKKSTTNRVKANDAAGAPQRTGHLQITIDRRTYKAHRLAWLYAYGILPAHQVDHINGNPRDNRICNLREATSAQNQQNQRNKPHKLLGISWHKASNKCQARITISGELKHLGVFATPQDAHTAYVEAKRQLHSFGTL